TVHFRKRIPIRPRLLRLVRIGKRRGRRTAGAGVASRCVSASRLWRCAGWGGLLPALLAECRLEQQGGSSDGCERPYTGTKGHCPPPVTAPLCHGSTPGRALGSVNKPGMPRRVGSPKCP